MEPNEKKLALALLVGLVVVCGGILAAAAMLGGGTDPAQREGTRELAAPTVEELERRVAELEWTVKRLHESSHTAGDARRPAGASAGATRAGSGGTRLPVQEETVEAWVQTPVVREALTDTVDLEREHREALERERIRDQEVAERDRAFLALSEAVGLNASEQDSIRGILADVERRHDELTERAGDLLLEPGPLDEDLRAAYREWSAEKRELYIERNERLQSILGDQKYRDFRRYEAEQRRKSEMYDALSSPPIPSKKKSPRRNKRKD